MTYEHFDQKADDLITMSHDKNALQAIDLLKKALQYVGESKYLAYDAYFCLGMRYQQLEDHPKAIEFFTKAIDLESNALPLLWRGESHMAMGKKQEARQDIEDAAAFPEDEGLHTEDYALATEYLKELGGTIRKRKKKKSDHTLPTPKLPELNPIDPKSLIPPSGKLIFSTEIQYQHHNLFSILVDGSDLIQLTEGQEMDNAPSYSPDGNKVVFSTTRFRDGWKLSIMDADGNNLKQLTYGFANDFQPRWSPDGSRIVFRSNRDTHKFKYGGGGDSQLYQLWIIEVDSGEIQRITHDLALFDSDPCWTSDGETVIFTSSDGKRPSTIQKIELTKGTREIIAQDAILDYFGPACSPDGRQIIFTSIKTDESGLKIDALTMDIETKIIKRIANYLTPGTGLKWSPTGEHIAFSSSGYGNNDVYVMNADGTGITPLNIPNICGSPDWKM